MQRVKQVLEILVLLLFALFLLLVCYFTIHGARKVKAIGDDLDRTIIIVAGAATNVEKASRAWESSSKSQADHTSLAAANVAAAAGAFTSFVSKTDASVNSSILPALKETITSQNASLSSAEKDLDSAILQLGSATSQAQKVLVDADAQIANPAIAKAIDSFADSSSNLARATSDGAATMQSVRSGVEYEVAQLERPVKKVKAVFLFILTALGKFLGV